MSDSPLLAQNDFAMSDAMLSALPTSMLVSMRDQITATLKQRSEDRLGSIDAFYSDAAEDIAHALAHEIEAADLEPGDLVTVNREKLRGIAHRVLAKAKGYQEGTGR